MSGSPNSATAGTDAAGESESSSRSDAAVVPDPESANLGAAVTVASVQSSARAVEAEASRLRSQLVAVTAALSSRTSRSARWTVSHAAVTDALASEASVALDRLRATTEMFVTDANKLKQHFETLEVLAKQTATVRAELTKLEMQTAKIAAGRRTGAMVGR